MIEITSPEDARQVIAEILERAASTSVVLPHPPEEPDPRSCCGRGCTPCVFSHYYEATGAWRDSALLSLAPGKAES